MRMISRKVKRRLVLVLVKRVVPNLRKVKLRRRLECRIIMLVLI